MAQARYWKEFHQLKVQTIYIQKLLLDAERNERLAKMVTAITSSASIGAWVVWKDWAMLWGAIIAGAQVFSVIHPLLPYKERLKTYSSVLRDLEKLFIDAEHKWQTVADGSMSTQQINKERTLLQKKSAEIVNRYMPNSVFPSSPKIADLAESEAANYFSRYYPQEEDNSTESPLLLQIKSLTENGTDE
jgi:hypothetical protein